MADPRGPEAHIRSAAPPVAPPVAPGPAPTAAPTARPTAALGAALALVLLCAGVLGVHALAGARTTDGWFAGEPGGQADLAWRQTECLGDAVAQLVPAGAAVYVAFEVGPLAQRLQEYAFRRGVVVGAPAEAQIVLTLLDTPDQGCGGVTLATVPQ